MKTKQTFEQAIETGLIDRNDGVKTLDYIQEQQRLRNWKQGSINRQYQAIRPFLEEMKRKGLTLSTLDKKGVLELIGFIQDTQLWSEDTRKSNWDRFCAFYKWAYKQANKTWKPEAAELLTGEERYFYKRDLNKIVQKDILTPEQMLELVATEPSLEYKVFFGVTFEAGMRVGESLSLLIKDVSKSDKGFDIDIRSSKTQKRRVFVERYFEAVLDRWLKSHPDRNNPNAPLFLNQHGSPLTGFAANKKLKLICNKLWPEKTKVSVHSLRHSRASELAEMYTESALCAFFGWTVGSKMTTVYVRRASIDIRGIQRRAYGLEQTKPKEVGRKCLTCSHVNMVTADFCEVCQQPVSPEQIARLHNSAPRGDVIKAAVREVFEQMMLEKAIK